MTTTPPSGPPATGGEYLDSGGGRPDRAAGGGRRTALVGGAAVAALAVVGGGVWAATGFFATGEQPAQALPASTLAYLSVDLDPSGEQKIAALRTLNRFPAFEEGVDLQTDDDLREKLAELALEDAGCDVSYDEGIAPWLGNRFAVAAVDLGEDEPSPVLVAQVTDAAAAEEGLADLAACGEEGAGFVVEGDWAVVAETEALADEVVAQTAEGTLADDGDFQRWTGETGDAGIVTGYAAPALGTVLAEQAQAAGGDTAPDGLAYPASPDVLAALEGFEGAALTVRFGDGSIEAVTAADAAAAGLGSLYASDQGGAAVQSLPADTGAALGVAFEPGWATELVDYVARLSGRPAEELTSVVEQQTGLSVPEDVEALLGESATLSVGSDLDPAALSASEDLSAIPVALRVQGDPEAVEGAVATIAQRLEVPGPLLESDTDDDVVAFGPSNDYREEVLGDGGLGEDEVFAEVVPEADRASAVLFVGFDAGDGWVERLAEGDDDVVENLEPLRGAGLAVWGEDDVSYSMLSVTTD